MGVKFLWITYCRTKESKVMKMIFRAMVNKRMTITQPQHSLIKVVMSNNLRKVISST